MRFHPLRFAPLAVFVALTGCADRKACEDFAQHLAEVVAKEKGSELDATLRQKMIDKTIDSCIADPPSPQAMACAMKAESTEAMQACDAESES